MQIVRRPVDDDDKTSGKKPAGKKPAKPVHKKRPAKAGQPAKKSLKMKKPKAEKVKKAKKEKVHVTKGHKGDSDISADDFNNHSGISEEELRVRRVKKRLPGYCKLYGDGELAKMVQMNTSDKSIAQFMKMRILLLIVSAVIGVVLGFVLMKTQAKTGSGIAGIARSVGGGIAGGLLLGAGLWAMDVKNKSMQYNAWLIQRQIAFSQFVRMVAAYAPGLANGTNLFSLMKKIAPRMSDKRDRASIHRLMLAMQDNPADPGPWREFAHDFSTSSRAELTMLTIQRMYLGNIDDTAIRSLAEDSNNDLTRQIDKIIEMKTNRYQQIATKLSITVMIVIVGVLGLMLFDQFTSMMGKMGDMGGM